MKKIRFIFMLVMLLAILLIPHIVNANENMYVDFLCAYPNGESYISQIKKITSRNFYDDGTFHDYIREFIKNDSEKTITIYLDGAVEAVLYLDDINMVSGYASTGYDHQSHYVYYYDDEITVYEGWQEGDTFHIKKDGSCILNASTVYASKPDRDYKYDNLGRIIYSKGSDIESWIEYYDSTTQPVAPIIKCETYSADVFPKSGFTNFNDNDKTGTPFQFIVDTSTNIKDIYVMTENNTTKIPSSDFNYLSGPVLDGDKLLWTFELNMNQAGMRTLTIYGVDENGNVSNGKPISFEVISQKTQQLDTPILYLDGKKINANDRISVHKSDNLILSWDSVPNADKYTVYVWGVNNNEPLYDGYAKTFQIDKNILEYADYGITVYANSSSKQYTQSECWFAMNVTPKLVVTSNAESFNKNKTLVAPANCISDGKTEQACSDVYVDCDTNYTITWTNVKTGKEDKTWCDYNNDNKYLIKSWIKQNNSSEQRKIKVTLTAENLSFTYYIIQESGIANQSAKPGFTATSSTTINVSHSGIGYIEYDNGMIVYKQNEGSWADDPYPYSTTGDGSQKTISTSGCGLLSLKNAVYYLNTQNIDIDIMRKFALGSIKSGNITFAHRSSEGTNWSFFNAFATSQYNTYNFKFSNNDCNLDNLKNCLINNGVAITSSRNLSYKKDGTPTWSGHFMAIVDYNAETDEYLFLDSYKTNNRFGASAKWAKIDNTKTTRFGATGYQLTDYDILCRQFFYFYNN